MYLSYATYNTKNIHYICNISIIFWLKYIKSNINSTFLLAFGWKPMFWQAHTNLGFFFFFNEGRRVVKKLRLTFVSSNLARRIACKKNQSCLYALHRYCKKHAWKYLLDSTVLKHWQSMNMHCPCRQKYVARVWREGERRWFLGFRYMMKIVMLYGMKLQAKLTSSTRWCISSEATCYGRP